MTWYLIYISNNNSFMYKSNVYTNNVPAYNLLGNWHGWVFHVTGWRMLPQTIHIWMVFVTLHGNLCEVHHYDNALWSFLAATKQLYKWYFPSVRLSVRLSVTPFSPCSHHRIIMKCSGVITMVKSGVHAKGQGQRSKVKVTEVNTQLSRFRTLTPVWIHIWQWNHAHSCKQHRRCALLFFKVIRQISRSHGSKNRLIWPRLGVSGL